MRTALRRRRLRRLGLEPAPLLLDAAARPARDLSADRVQGRLHRLRATASAAAASATRTRSTGRVPRSSPIASGTGSPSGRQSFAPTTRPPSGCSGVADYEGMTAADELLREYGEEIGVGETFKHTRVGIFFGPPGEQVDDPYFGGDGPGAHRLRALRRLHDRLSLRRQEHPGQELPLVRRAARGRGDRPSAR